MANTDRYARRVLASLRAHWRILPVYVAVLWPIDFFRILALAPGRSWVETAQIGALVSVNAYWLAAPLAYLAIALAEALRLHGVWRAVATILLIGAAVGIASVTLLITDARVVRDGVNTLLIQSSTAFTWRYWWFHSAMALMLAGYLAVREREAAIVRAARDAELERAQTQRAVLDSRLKVLQARVEPELLFGVLSDAIELYPRDSAQADRLLDDLIAYLRAALPHLRRDSSTVSREIALAQAWVRIAPSLRDVATPLACSVAPELHDAPFPPLVLLPLVEGAVAGGARDVALRARVPPMRPGDETGAQIEVSIGGDDVPAAWSGERLGELRAIVATALPDAQVEVTRESARVTLQLCWRPTQAATAQGEPLTAR